MDLVNNVILVADNLFHRQNIAMTTTSFEQRPQHTRKSLILGHRVANISENVLTRLAVNILDVRRKYIVLFRSLQFLQMHGREAEKHLPEANCARRGESCGYCNLMRRTCTPSIKDNCKTFREDSSDIFLCDLGKGFMYATIVSQQMLSWLRWHPMTALSTKERSEAIKWRTLATSGGTSSFAGRWERAIMTAPTTL